MTVENTPFLRNTLLADAAMGIAAAALTILGSGFLASLLALPQGLIFWAGVALVPIAIFLLAMVRKQHIPPSWLREIVLINWAWVVASIAVLAFANIKPNLLGTAFILAQAFAVAVFASLQGMALSRSRALAT